MTDMEIITIEESAHPDIDMYFKAERKSLSMAQAVRGLA